MTQLTEHAKSILRAIADGKDIHEFCSGVGWMPCHEDHALDLLAQGKFNKLRIAHETRSINGVEFTAPVINGGYRLMLRNGGSDNNNWEARDFTEAKDRDTAYQAIIDALNGVTK